VTLDSLVLARLVKAAISRVEISPVKSVDQFHRMVAAI